MSILDPSYIFLLLTFILAIYTSLKNTSKSRSIFLAIIFSGMIISVLVPGNVPLYPQWNFYPEPVDQKVTYHQLLIEDKSGDMLFYDHSASSLGSSGRVNRPSIKLVELEKQKKNLLACQLLEDAKKYRRKIENEKSTIPNTPKGYGKKWNKSFLANYSEFYELQVQRETIYLDQNGKNIKNSSQSIEAKARCS